MTDRRASVLLVGNGQRSLEVAAALHAGGWPVTLVRGDSPPLAVPFDLAILEAAVPADLAGLPGEVRRRTPWLVLCASEDGRLTTEAYRAGAVAVLPFGAPADLVPRTVERTVRTLLPPTRHPRERRFRVGERLSLEADVVLEVLEGIVVQGAIHPDGSEVLLGFVARGDLLTGHPHDSCCLELTAQTEVRAVIHPWPAEGLSGAMAEALRTRVRRLEAWNAMQARPFTMDRLRGILSLLAEQLGEDYRDGRILTVRVTHAQLAAAVGATRATVTRLLGSLRKSREVERVTLPDGERLWLRRWEELRHEGHG